ncbi:ABC transporter permease [Acidihalobacter ferrooxydans]|uniref:Peptide ABC transporter permease n=1 Tax=Acidihalobacter ferrooxydans TaxID=1765967 RepID=A0A1P8UJP7_9GAMM|nr:ABC transporter permease [Acidihalobacter ferrooxydans]APZ44014.1 peptide ABC transporter permease [Acidihalobacter ferrooxydans]
MRANLTLAIGAAMLLVWIVTALGAPWLAPYSPTALDFSALDQAPSWAHWFGTDNYGRDVLSRVMYGGREVLLVAPAATLLGLALGAAIGLTTAYYGRWVDEAIMRTLDAVMALPIVVLALLALTVLGPSTLNVILVIGLVFSPLIARTVRAQALVETQQEYVAAARLRGESAAYIIAVEILPNVRGPLIVEGTIRVGYAVFTAATLGFLGLGVQPPTPDWGLMVSEGQAQLTVAPWVVLFPALAIVFVVVGVSLVADGLRERLQG